jgi:hypothetical protein
VAGEIIKQSEEAMRSLVKVLGGIIKKSPDGKYDALSNILTLGRPSLLFEEYAACIDQFNKAIKLMDDIETMEAAK